MQSLKGAPLNAPVGLLRKLPDVKRVDDPMGGKQDLGLFRIRVDSLPDEHNSDLQESELIEDSKRVSKFSA
jgi:hypothetical protein